jgi:hypothetical protein
MSIEELVIGHNLLKVLDETQLTLLLEVIESDDLALPSAALETFYNLAAELEAAFGSNYPAVVQLGAALKSEEVKALPRNARHLPQ